MASVLSSENALITITVSWGLLGVGLAMCMIETTICKYEGISGQAVLAGLST